MVKALLANQRARARAVERPVLYLDVLWVLDDESQQVVAGRSSFRNGGAVQNYIISPLWFMSDRSWWVAIDTVCSVTMLLCLLRPSVDFFVLYRVESSDELLWPSFVILPFFGFQEHSNRP